MDATRWPLADGTDVEILNLEDDHSRFFLASVAFPTVKAADVVQVFHEAGQQYDHPLPAFPTTAPSLEGARAVGTQLEDQSLGLSTHLVGAGPRSSGAGF